jgi:catechol 2,3-dioxygenase-like lactoylglutathione lyase family enzyme
MSIGLHHLSLICSNARRTVRFYTDVLGLRLVKVTVDFDNPDHYHLYFGSHQGTPGTLISIYEWHIAHRAQPGVGGIRRMALGVNDLAAWQVRLAGQAVTFAGAFERNGRAALRLRDPDGTEIELMEESLQTETPRIDYLSCLSADLPALDSFYGELLGMEAVALPQEAGQTRTGWGVGGKALLEFEAVPSDQVFPAPGRAGTRRPS